MHFDGRMPSQKAEALALADVLSQGDAVLMTRFSVRWQNGNTTLEPATCIRTFVASADGKLQIVLADLCSRTAPADDESAGDA